jgi:simple sugar transport system permease protein
VSTRARARRRPISWRRVVVGVIAPVAALIFSLLVSSIALLLIHKSPLTAFHQMLSYGLQTNSMIAIVNTAIPLYLAGLAVAVGFKMNLFNIGVEGQYRLAALLAAAAGAELHLPPPIHITVILLIGIAVGAVWAGIAGLLKVTRGVSEVISTIMLNFIAFGLIAYLLAPGRLQKPVSASDLTTQTREIPTSGLMPALLHNPFQSLSGVLIIAVVLGILYYVLVWRTRFGYDLRAAGLNPEAARVSGVGLRTLIMQTMLLSGGIAGLVGMNQVLFFSHAYTLDFPQDLGFSGIAVALVGRNNPIGIALAALLFGFLQRSSQILDLNNVPKEITQIMTGVIILSVVIAYELVQRWSQAQEVKSAAEQTRHVSRTADAKVPT